MRRLVLLVLAVVIGKTSELAEANQFKTYGGNLKALCKGKQTDFRNVGDLRNMIYQSDKEEAQDCGENVIKALHELDRITRDSRACSVAKAQAITQFFATYLRNSQDQEDFERLPKPITRFALAYGMRVSHVCTRHVVDTFLKKAESTLTKQDFKELGEWASEKGPVGRLLAPLKKPEEIILPSDLSAVLPDDKVTSKFRVKAVSSGKVKRLKELCQKRFKPLYEQSLIPLAILSNSGIDYKQMSLIKDLKLRSKVVPKVALWSRIVFLCESLEAVEISEAAQAQEQAQQTPEVQPDEEDEALLEDVAEGYDEAEKTGAPSVAAGPRPLSELLQVEAYFPEAKVDDEIMGHLDLRLKTIVWKYNKKKSDVERSREKLLKRGWRLLVARFKYGEMKALLKPGVEQMKAALSRKGKLQMVNDELLDLLDAKDETRLFKILSKVCRTKKALGRWIVVFLIRLVLAAVVAVLIISELNHDKVDELNDELRKYNTL